MNTLQELKPTDKLNIIDLVEESGIDVSPWQFTKAGKPATKPASNGRFCYEWRFKEGETKILLCLWHADFEEDEGGIYQRGNIRAANQRGDFKGPQRKRAELFDSALQLAAYHNVPVRAVILDGYTRQSKDDEASKVAKRLLDRNWWRVSKYDQGTGDYELRRLAAAADATAGAKPPAQPWSTAQAAPTPQAETTATVAPPTQARQADEAETTDQQESQLAQDLRDIDSQTDIPETEREALIHARIGQGEFRRQLLTKWEGRCAVTGCDLADVLRASHCKPWCDSTHVERLNAANGLLLSANLDALFDRYLISFEDDGEMLVSPRISEEHRRLLSLPGRLRRPPTEVERYFLSRHRTVFLSKQLG